MEKNEVHNLGVLRYSHNSQLQDMKSVNVKINAPNENNASQLPFVDGKSSEEMKKTSNVVLMVRKRMYDISQHNFVQNFILPLLLHSTIITYVILAVLNWYKRNSEPLEPYNGLGLLLVIIIVSYWSLFYYKYAKPFFLNHSFSIVNTKHWVFRFRFSVCLCGYSIHIIIMLLILLFVIYDSGKDVNRLKSLSGIFVTISGGYLFSKHPSHVKWDVVFKGILIQFIMAVLTIRWAPGKLILKNIGSKIEQFLSYSYIGAAFVYSDDLVYKHTVFAFQCLSVIFFVNFLVEVLFYLKILQKLFTTLGWLLQKAIGTTAVESINCCVSVFFGLTEAMLVIKPYIVNLTDSELHAVMLGQLSTVAGSVFAAYTSFGVNSAYLVTAAVMSAPGALALSKLLYPELEKSKTTAEILNMENDVKEKHSSILTAGCDGAIAGVSIVTGIIANLIAFISLVAFVNAVVSWLAALIGFNNMTLVSIFGKIFTPIAYLIGVDSSQCHLVGELISIKVIINEFVAYKKLGNFKAANLLSHRSEAIATYALCSFSNPGSIACQIAGISALCPSKLEQATKLALRAYLGGIISCFVSASIAGLLIPSEMYYTSSYEGFNDTNSTMSSL